jgi:hypothetical protein
MVHRATAGVDGVHADHQLVGAVSATSLAVAAAGLVGALVAGGPAQIILLSLAVGFPLVAVLDCTRYIAIARGLPGRAAALDSVRVFGFLLVYAAWSVAGDPTALGVVLLWLGSGVIGLIGLALALRVPPQRPAISAWWRTHGRMAMGFGAENLMLRISAYSVAYSLVWFATLPDVAGFRAGSSLTNLITIFFASVPMVLMPHYRRRLTTASGPVGRGPLLRIAGTVTTAVVVMTAAGSVILLNLPEDIGTALFGDTWTEARESLPGLLFWTAGSAATLGPLLVLRATARVKRSVTARFASSVVIMVTGMTGAALAGAPGAAYGLGIGAWMGVVGWYVVVWRDGSWSPPSADDGAAVEETPSVALNPG